MIQPDEPILYFIKLNISLPINIMLESISPKKIQF